MRNVCCFGNILYFCIVLRLKFAIEGLKEEESIYKKAYLRFVFDGSNLANLNLSRNKATKALMGM